MKVSIVTVCFNSARTIAATLRSVAEQTHRDIDHVIVDGGSTDGTLEILGRWTMHPLSIVSEPDRGLYDAMNKGLRRFEGEIAGFLNSDDRFASRKTVADIADRFSADPRVDCLYGDLRLVAADARVLRVWRSGAFHRKRLERGWLPPHPTFYARRSLVDRVGSFDTRYRIAADIDWMLRALDSSSAEPAYLDATMVEMAVGGTSTAGWRAVVEANQEVYSIARTHGIAHPMQFVVRKLASKVGQVVAARLAPRPGRS